MKAIKREIENIKSNLYEERDKCVNLRLDFETEFGASVSNITRRILLNQMIYLFKNYNKQPKIILLKEMSNLTTRMRLHYSQLKRLSPENYTENKDYFNNVMRILFRLILL